MKIKEAVLSHCYTYGKFINKNRYAHTTDFRRSAHFMQRYCDKRREKSRETSSDDKNNLRHQVR